MSSVYSITDYNDTFFRLQLLWQKDKKEFSKTVKFYICQAVDPFDFIIICLLNDNNLYKNKGSSMALELVTSFSDYINEQGKIEKNYDKYNLLRLEVQNKAFSISLELKNILFLKSLINAYNLKQINMKYLPYINNLLRDDIKLAGNLICLLGLHSYFTCDNLLIPLFLRNLTEIIEGFLDVNSSERVKFIQFLDGIVGQKSTLTEVARQYENVILKNVMSLKAITNLIARLLKKYNMDISICPLSEKRRILGTLRYLFYRYYIEKSVSLESFYELVLDILKQNPALQFEVFDLFIDYDSNDAVYIVKQLNISKTDLPHQIQNAIGRNSKSEDSALTFACSNLSILPAIDADSCNKYYKLSISENDVTVVDNVKDFEKCLKVLKKSKEIGIDSEWKPSIGLHSEYLISILQIATKLNVFILDICRLLNELSSVHWQNLGTIFTDSSIMKYTYGFSADLKGLCETCPLLKEYLMNSKSFVELNTKKNLLLETFPNFFDKQTSIYKGLAELVYLCFGKPLDKKEQFSKWDTRPLSKSQLRYAALDAYVLLEVAVFLQTQCSRFGIDFFDVFKVPNLPKTKNLQKAKKLDLTNDPRIERKAVHASNIKFACDTMIQGLGRYLRHCGIDTTILENDEAHNKCIELYDKEKRIVLTRGNVFFYLKKCIPLTHLYDVKGKTSKDQLHEVINAFNIIVNHHDIFGRCGICNSGAYLILSCDLMKRIKHNVELQKNLSPQWYLNSDEKIDINNGIMCNGVKIRVLDIPIGVIVNRETFYICKKCGKCYWDGLHMERLLCSSLQSVVCDSSLESPMSKLSVENCELSKKSLNKPKENISLGLPPEEYCSDESDLEYFSNI